MRYSGFVTVRHFKGLSADHIKFINYKLLVLLILIHRKLTLHKWILAWKITLNGKTRNRKKVSMSTPSPLQIMGGRKRPWAGKLLTNNNRKLVMIKRNQSRLQSHLVLVCLGAGAGASPPSWRNRQTRGHWNHLKFSLHAGKEPPMLWAEKIRTFHRLPLEKALHPFQAGHGRASGLKTTSRMLQDC